MMPNAVVDLHSHWFAPDTLAYLSGRNAAPRIIGDGAAAAIETTIGQLPLGRQWWDIDHRVQHLDRHNVVHQLLSWPTTLNLEPMLPFEEARQVWTRVNDGFGALVRMRGDRFSALAVLSSERPDWSAAELRRAHNELGLIGFVLPINAFASADGVRYLRPLLREAQRLGSHLYLHTGYAAPTVPGQPTAVENPANAGAAWTLGAMHHFAAAFATVALSDALDDYPDITIQVAMLAGAGAGVLLLEQARISPERFGGAPDPARLARLWLDTGALGQGPAAISAAIEILGAERIVFGSDYAPASDVGTVLGHVTRATRDAQQARALLFGNAQALLARHGVRIPDPIPVAEGHHVRV